MVFIWLEPRQTVIVSAHVMYTTYYNAPVYTWRAKSLDSVHLEDRSICRWRLRAVITRRARPLDSIYKALLRVVAWGNRSGHAHCRQLRSWGKPCHLNAPQHKRDGDNNNPLHTHSLSLSLSHTIPTALSLCEKESVEAKSPECFCGFTVNQLKHKQHTHGERQDQQSNLLPKLHRRAALKTTTLV